MVTTRSDGVEIDSIGLDNFRAYGDPVRAHAIWEAYSADLQRLGLEGEGDQIIDRAQNHLQLDIMLDGLVHNREIGLMSPLHTGPATEDDDVYDPNTNHVASNLFAREHVESDCVIQRPSASKPPILFDSAKRTRLSRHWNDYPKAVATLAYLRLIYSSTGAD